MKKIITLFIVLFFLILPCFANNINAQSYFKSGESKFKSKNYASSIEDFTKAIQLNSNDFMSYVGRGSSKKELKDYKGAIEDLTKAIQLNPNYSDSYRNRGYSKYSLKDYVGAVDDYTKAIKLNPRNNAAYAYRAIIKFQKKDYQGSIEDCTKSIQINPNIYAVYYARGKVEYRLKYYKSATEDYTKAIQLNPNFLDAYVERTLCKIHLKDYRGAISDYTKAIQLSPKDALSIMIDKLNWRDFIFLLGTVTSLFFCLIPLISNFIKRNYIKDTESLLLNDEKVLLISEKIIPIFYIMLVSYLIWFNFVGLTGLPTGKYDRSISCNLFFVGLLLWSIYGFVNSLITKLIITNKRVLYRDLLHLRYKKLLLTEIRDIKILPKRKGEKIKLILNNSTSFVIRPTFIDKIEEAQIILEELILNPEKLKAQKEKKESMYKKWALWEWIIILSFATGIVLGIFSSIVSAISQ